jgi:hypothetical protein
LRARLSRTVDGHALLSATWDQLVLRKVIHSSGNFHAQLEQGRDRLALCGSPARLSVTYGTRSLTLTFAAEETSVRRRVRELLLAAPVVQLYRRLAFDLEAADAFHPEAFGLRVTGAVLAEIDGDEAAVRRLGRAALARERSLVVSRIDSADAARHANMFSERLLRASVELEQRTMRSSSWNAARASAAFEWALHIEAATFALVASDLTGSIPR